MPPQKLACQYLGGCGTEGMGWGARREVVSSVLPIGASTKEAAGGPCGHLRFLTHSVSRGDLKG